MFKKCHRFAAVDNAVIVSERDVHHGPDHDGTITSDRPVFDGMKSKHAALRRIHDGRREHRSIDAAIADRECAALKLIDFKLVRLRALGEVRDGAFDVGETQAFGIAQNGNDQSLPAAHGNADVVVVAINDVVAANFRVDLWNQFERIDTGPHEERHEAELDLILRLECLLVLLSQGHDGRHVDLIEGRQQRRSFLRFDETFGNAAANGSHRNDLLFAGGRRWNDDRR